MVKITNGINVFEVTTGAYTSIYKNQGYQLVSDPSESESFLQEDNKEHKNADKIFTEELRKKPISQWSKDEVKRYASVEGIDLTGTKSVAEAKDVIKGLLK